MPILIISLLYMISKGSLACCVLTVGCQTVNVLGAMLEASQATSSKPTAAGGKAKQGNSQSMTLWNKGHKKKSSSCSRGEKLGKQLDPPRSPSGMASKRHNIIVAAGGQTTRKVMHDSESRSRCPRAAPGDPARVLRGTILNTMSLLCRH